MGLSPSCTARHSSKMSLNKEVYRRIGALGERRVAEYLKANGYIIVKRNWRDRYGEIDIIAQKDKTLCFVEVKTRDEAAIVSGLEAVDYRKQRRIRITALRFKNRLKRELDVRFDVAEVTVVGLDGGGYGMKLKYIKSAF